MRAPVHVYYRLDSYYQNHKRYVRSRQYKQLHGLEAASAALSVCNPQLHVRAALVTPAEATLVTGDGTISPCGLAAWSFFNDTFSDFAVTSAGAVEPLFVNSSQLVWASDRDTLFGNYEPHNLNTIERFRGGGALKSNVSSDEHFMAWMKFSARPGACAADAWPLSRLRHTVITTGADVKKYWGRIDRDLAPGEVVTLSVADLYNMGGFGGKKWVVLATNSSLGGRNFTFGFAWLACGVLWLAIALSYRLAGGKRWVMRSDGERLEWLRSRLTFDVRKAAPESPM